MSAGVGVGGVRVQRKSFKSVQMEVSQTHFPPSVFSLNTTLSLPFFSLSSFSFPLSWEMEKMAGVIAYSPATRALDLPPVSFSLVAGKASCLPT